MSGEEARHTGIQTVWSHLCEFIEQSNLIYSGCCYGGAWGTFWGGSSIL